MTNLKCSPFIVWDITTDPSYALIMGNITIDKFIETIKKENTNGEVNEYIVRPTSPPQIMEAAPVDISIARLIKVEGQIYLRLFGKWTIKELYKYMANLVSPEKIKMWDCFPVDCKADIK